MALFGLFVVPATHVDMIYNVLLHLAHCDFQVKKPFDLVDRQIRIVANLHKW